MSTTTISIHPRHEEKPAAVQVIDCPHGRVFNLQFEGVNIYLTRESAQNIVRALQDALAPGRGADV